MMRFKPSSMILLKLVVFIILAIIIELATSFELSREEYPDVGRSVSEASIGGASSSPWDLTKSSLLYDQENPDLIYERTITESRIIHDVFYNRDENSPSKKKKKKKKILLSLISPILKGLKNLNTVKSYRDEMKFRNDNERLKESFNDSTNINRDTETVLYNSKIDKNNEKKINSKFIDLTESRKGDNNDGDDKIIFMDSDDKRFISRNAFVPNTFDNECDDTTVCKKMKKYPKNYIENIIKNMSNLIPFSGIDEINKIEQRFQDIDGDTPLCQSEESTYFFEGVRKDLNDPNSWHILVNGKNFLQGIRINQCLNSTRGCTVLNRLSESDLPNYNTFCKQQYIHHKLVVLSRENGTPIVDSFPIPSGCCCHIIIDTPSRFRENDDQAINLSNTSENNNKNDDNNNNNNNNKKNNKKKNNYDTSITERMKKWRNRIIKGGKLKNNNKKNI